MCIKCVFGSFPLQYKIFGWSLVLNPHADYFSIDFSAFKEEQVLKMIQSVIDSAD